MRPPPEANPGSPACLIALTGGSLPAPALPASAATVATDKADYAPGENVVITGSGWEPGETVVLILHEEPQLDPDLQLTAFADENGDFTNTDFSVDIFDIGVTFTLTATGGSSGLSAEMTFTDAPGTCGNGIVESGEQCDLGAANGNASCCKMNCSFANAGAACTDDGNPCTLDQCSGTSSTCQHPAGNAGAACRAAAGECDLAETCTGTSATCPTNDVKKASALGCTDDRNPCTLDQCDGTSNACQHPAGNAGATCRAVAGPCDVAETCTGTSTTCPANGFLSASTVCRTATNECDMAETCTGTSATCPTDLFKSSTTPCTDDGNPCTADVCSGTSATCTHPAGNAGAPCLDDGDPCTTDTCDGASTTCQHPPGNPGGVCRAAANECDVEETCPGAFTIGFPA